jgi:hypothetical protein
MGLFSQFWVRLSDPPVRGHGAVNASRRVPKMFGIANCCSKAGPHADHQDPTADLRGFDRLLHGFSGAPTGQAEIVYAEISDMHGAADPASVAKYP